MRDNYDFSDAVKNPFAGKINGKYTVTIHYDFTDNSKVMDDIKEVELSPDDVMGFKKYRHPKKRKVN